MSRHVMLFVTSNKVGLVVVGYLLHLEGTSGSARLEQTGLAGMWGSAQRESDGERDGKGEG
jgi:hypothetical protein